MHRKKAFVLMAVLLCLLLGGCMLQPAEDLYALPKQPAEYYTLQNRLDAILEEGGTYCAPVSGDRRQAVQLADLDSDGQEEAIAFFKMPGEKPLKTYIFHKTSEGYEEYACIEGDGSAFESVSYCQIDTTLGLELVIGRQVSDQVPQALSVYSVADGEPAELLNVSCIRHTLADLDESGLQELLVFRLEDDSSSGVTDYYRWNGSAMELAGSAGMTADLTADSIRRIVCGMMQADTPAVFVANAYDPEMLTIVSDVFMLDGDDFCNVCARGDSANAAHTIRYQRVYAVDIDADGLIELPAPVKLPSVREDSTDYYMIDWYNLRSDASREYKRSTFHNYTDGWYLDLSDDWKKDLAVDTLSGMNGYGFYRAGGDLRFAVYAFPGRSAQLDAGTDGRFILGQKGDVVYAGEIFDTAITESQLRDAFHFIFTDWNSGEV